MQAKTRIMKYLQARRRIAIFSGPGKGKTERLRQITEMLGMEFIRTTPGIEERTDYSGCFVPDLKEQMTKVLPLETLKRLKETTKPTLWLLDDLGNALMDVQAAIKGQITSGGPFKNHPFVTIAAASNRPGDKTGVNALHESLRSEFDLAFTIPDPGQEEAVDGGVFLTEWAHRGVVCQTGCELCGWVEWAQDYGSPGEIIGFHRATSGRVLYQWKPHNDPSVRMPDFRSWHVVIDLWKANIRDMTSLSAAIGKPAAIEFTAFAALSENVPTPDEIFANPTKAPVPEDPSALYLVVSMLSARAEAKLAKPLVEYIIRLPRVYAALLARDIFRKLKSALSTQPAWQDWFYKNQEFFSVN